MKAVEYAFLIDVDVVRRVGSCVVMNGSQNDLQPGSEVLVKFLVFGGATFSVLLKDGWGNFLGHVLCPRVDVVDSYSHYLLHVQKGGDGLLSDDDLDPHNL